jgi:hypothetical protein
MFIPTTQSLLKNKFFVTLMVLLVIAWMAVYPIYNNYYKGLAIEQYERFVDWKAGHSMFFNPWQYRVLCPMLVEGLYQLFDHTVFAIFPIHAPEYNLPGNAQDKNAITQKMLMLSSNPEFIKYSVVFVLFRFLEHLLIFWLAFKYFSLFVKNQALIILGVMLVPIFMANGVMDSDLAFNSYMDVILYLWAGIVIVKDLNWWWIVLISVLGAFNRETSLLIPVIFFFSKVEWTNLKAVPVFLKDNIKLIAVCVTATVLFLAIFVSVRVYYGYQPQTQWRVPAGPQMLKLNLFSGVAVKSYNEIFGVLGFLPIWCLLFFKQMNRNLKIFFIALVPVWFAVHFISVVAYQGRLFLVPCFLVFLPAVLEYIDSFSNRPATLEIT